MWKSGKRTLFLSISMWTLAGACGAGPGDAEPDAGPPDTGSDGGVVAPGAPELYPADQTLSPITPHVASNLRDIAARGPALADNAFAKVGDSATHSLNFLHCLDDGYVDPAAGEQRGQIELNGRDALKPTIEHFRDGNAGGINPYVRSSLASGPGVTAASVIAGEPSALDDEFAAASPRFAVIMFGMNDVEDAVFYEYGANLLAIADRSIATGVIPIFTATMPRDDSATADADVRRFNAIARGVAQSRQVPFIDLHRELSALSGHGLGPDGVHPSVFQLGGDARACAFTDEALAHGYNVRNLISLQTLDRVRRVVDDEPAPDPSVRALDGAGTADQPFVIASLPFTHFADTSAADSRAIDQYDGCQASQNEAGPEIFYRLDLDRAVAIRAMVIDRDGADIDVHLLGGEATGAACMERAHRQITANLDPGTYFLSLDTFVGSAGELAGEYLLVVMEE